MCSVNSKDVLSHVEVHECRLRHHRPLVTSRPQRGKLQDRSYERHYVWKEGTFGLRLACQDLHLPM